MTREEEKKFLIEHLVKVWESGANQNLKSLLSQVADWCEEHPKNPLRDEQIELPEDDRLVIGLFRDGSICGCRCSPEERIWFIDIFVTDPPLYWMPKPELPKGGEV